MTQKTTLLISALLTAFVLVIGGGVMARVSQVDTASAASVPVPTASTVDVNAQVQQLIQQRDAEYRSLIDEANRRLQAMNQQQAAAAQTAPVAAQPARAQSAAPQFAVSADMAASTAAQAAGGAPITRAPELVRFEGNVAYEVLFAKGAIYVDANTGQVLFNGTQRAPAPNPQLQPQSAPSGGYEQEHEQEQPHTQSQPSTPQQEQEHSSGSDD